MGLFSWFKPGKPAPEASTPAPATKTAPARRYDAVEVIPDPDGSCNAVRQLAGKRILANEVPLLPLKNCDRAKCACAYRRYKDRRSEPRRVSDMGVTLFDEDLPKDKERRKPHPGRRRSDHRQT